MDTKQRNRMNSFVLTVMSICYIGLGIETLLLKWEVWMALVIFASIIALWVVYFSRKITDDHLKFLLFLYGIMGSFYHGVHKISQFDIVVVSALLLTVISLLDKMYMLNIILLEFVAIMVNQIFMSHSAEMTNVTVLLVSRILLHSAAVVIIYLFCRLTVKNRLAKNAEIEEKSKEVELIKHDMQDFLSNISHELRTPVNVVNGMSRLFLNKKKQ